MRRHRIGLKGPFPIKDFTSIAVVSYFRDHQGLVSISSKGYELLVREIYQQMLDQDQALNVVVQHNVQKAGSCHQSSD